jgi:hypothetical protein
MGLHGMRSVLVAIALTVSARPAAAAAGTWYGTWTLDRGRSQLTGTTIRIVRIPNGYHFDFGAVRFDIGDDGKFYTTVPGRATSLRAVSDYEWVRIHRNNGKDVDRSVLRVSPDQRTLVIDTEAISPSGAVQRSRDIEQRIGEGHGLAGTWRSTKVGINVPEKITLSAASGGAILWGAPEDGNYFVVVPDGPPAVNVGPRAVASVKLAVRTASPTELRWTETIDGKPYMEGIDMLAKDGSLVETTWADQFPSEIQKAVYVRR